MPYFLSKAHTLDLVDPDELRRELTVRGIRCEVPGCSLVAVGMIASRITIFICKPHVDACAMSDTALRSIEAAAAMVLKSHMAQASNAAYEGSENEVTFSFDGTDRMLSMARQLAGATEIDQLPFIKLELPEPTIGERPTLASLESSNGIAEMPALFII